MQSRTIGVAIAIPEPWGGELQRRRSDFGDPLAPAIPTHITLLPPTRVADSDLPRIDEHLCHVAQSELPFEVQLRGTASFRPISPVVFVDVAAGADDCERVESRVRRGPLHREPRFAYHPHVTVAHDVPEEALDRAAEELSRYDACFEVWGFSLYEHGRDGLWRPQRDYAFGCGLPGPVHAGREDRRSLG